MKKLGIYTLSALLLSSTAYGLDCNFTKGDYEGNSIPIPLSKKVTGELSGRIGDYVAVVDVANNNKTLVLSISNESTGMLLISNASMDQLNNKSDLDDPSLSYEVGDLSLFLSCISKR